MDVQFIKKMCESYYNDFELSKTNFWKTSNDCILDLNNTITNTIQGLKTEDIELYETLFKFDRQFQYYIIYNLLEDHISNNFKDDSNSDMIAEIEIFSLTAFTTALVMAAAAMIGTPIITSAMNTAMTGLAKVNDSIHKKIKSLTNKHKVFGAIIRTDQEQCLKKCGIDGEKGINRWTLVYSLTGSSMNTQSQNQAVCLISCYLTTSCEYAETLASSYRQCLVSTGHDPNDIDSLSSVLNIPADYQCKVFHDLLISHGKEFNNVVEVCFPNSLSERNSYLKAYEASINSGLKTGKMQRAYIPNSSPKTNSNFPPRNNPNFPPRNNPNPNFPPKNR